MFDRSSQWKLFSFLIMLNNCYLVSLFVLIPSDFGYKPDEMFGEVCVPITFANPVPAVCPEGKTYQHTRG